MLYLIFIKMYDEKLYDDECKFYISDQEEEDILKNGDIITIDVVIGYKGYQGDAAWTYTVGEVDDDKKYLMEHTEKALYEGVKMVKPGNRIGDIAHAVQEYAESHNLGVVRELCGHGIGQEMHEDPFLFNYSVGDNTIIKANTAIAIEPMLNLGCDDVVVADDDWTVSTKDGKPSAHFEHTVIATEDGPLITTQLMK